MRGGRGHEILILAHAPHGAVIQHHPVHPQHHPITRAPDRKAGQIIHAQTPQQLERIRALHGDFAERGHIAQPDRFTHASGLAAIRGFQRLTGLREIPWPLPQSRRVHLRPGRQIKVMQRGAPQNAEKLARMPPGQRTERHRRIGRAIGCRADRARVAAGRFRHPPQARHIADLAAIKRHAERGVAFQMLDIIKPLAPGQPQVGAGDIRLKIHPCFALPPVCDFIHRSGRALPTAGGGRGRYEDLPTEMARRRQTCGAAGQFAIAAAPHRRRRPRDRDRDRCLIACGRHKTLLRLIPNRLHPPLRE